MIVGTPGYMAPEQARGQQVDKRADIWAFGVVLYEMLTGATLFRGDTMTDIMAAVVREEPDLTRVPASVRPVLRRCLEKDPKRRLRDIADAMLLLERAAGSAGGGSAAPGGRRTMAGVGRGRRAARGVSRRAGGASARDAAGLISRAIQVLPARGGDVHADGAVRRSRPTAASSPSRRSAMTACRASGCSDFSERSRGRSPRSQPNPLTLVWSPDSRQLLYSHQDQKLKRVDVGGGLPRRGCALGGPAWAFIGAAWFPDGRLCSARALA